MRPLVAAVAVGALLGPLVATQPAYATNTAGMTLTKSVNKSTLVPGETFQYSIQVGCSVLTQECINATLEDTIPSQFIVGSEGTLNITPAIPADITVSGQQVTVEFQAPLSNPSGQVGLTNELITVTIPLTVRSDLPHTPSPLNVTNTAVVDSDNTAPQESSVDVSLTVPLQVATTASKSFAPSTILGAPGSPTTVTVGGTNTSNSPIDTFTIQDPQAPVAATGIFAETLLVGSLSSVVWPQGATSATVSVWDAGAVTPGWVAAAPVAATGALSFPPGVALADIRGVRIAFTSGATAAIPTGATASFDLDTTLRQSGSGTRSNTSTSTVAIGATEATDTETRSLTLQAATSSVAAGKLIAPDRIATVAFEGSNATSALVTLTGSNSGTVPLQSLSISEPSDPTDLSSANPLAPGQPGGGLIFGSLGSIVWPAGATSASITYYYEGTPASTGSTSVVNTLPSPASTLPDPGSARVTGFTATFLGDSISPSATATVRFTVLSNPVQVFPLRSVDYSNTISVGGVDVFDTVVPPATATDTITVFSDQVAISTTKTLTRSTMSAVPGQLTTATLRTTIANYPESTRRVSTLSMFDPPPSDPTLTDWYTYFDATQLTLTTIPSGATLTVLYRDASGAYLPLTDLTSPVSFTDLAPGTRTIPIPAGVRDQIYGLELRWSSTTGFVPNQSLTANVDYALRSTLRDSAPAVDLPNEAQTLPNCSSATAQATGTGLDPASATSACPTVTLTTTTGGGGSGGSGGTGNISLAKRFLLTGSVTDQTLIDTRSSAQTRVRLTWSTGGLTGVTSMTVADSAPTPSSFTKEMYDAFNLYRINAINSTLDPQLQYDRVAVQLFDRVDGVWETPPGWPCTTASPCTSFSQRTLSPAERDLYVGVRFIFTERPNRTVLNPAPGSGVSSLGSARNIDLVYEIRDALRSSPSTPVVNGYRYNATMNGADSVVRNDADASAVLSTQTLTATANDSIQLQDPNLALTATKVWTGGPLPIPDTATVEPSPTSRVTLTTVNQGSTASELTISEPNRSTATPNDSPFSHFDLTSFYSITPPPGATGLTVTVSNGLTATGTTATAISEALGWTPAQLQDAEWFTLVYTGRIVRDEQAVVVVDLTLRPTLRGTAPPEALTAGTVRNSMEGTVSDLRFTGSDVDNPSFAPTVLAAIDDEIISILSSTLGVTTTKTFATTSQVEPTRTPITVTLAGTPSGSERVATLTLTDDRATFWNAFDLVNKGTITLPIFASPGGPAVLQVEACTGGTFTAGAIATTPTLDCTARGGTWSGAGTWLTQANLNANQFLTLPAGLTAADVTGLRLTLKRSDDAQWENPAAPTMSIPLSVQRRENLRSGGAVPSDYAGSTAAPGETVSGTTTNGLTADVLGIWGKTATASTTATYRYVHLTTSVQVQKLPTGVRSPGVSIPYTLQVRNTGQLPIVDPVITDFLPTDANGAMLIFNPDSATNYTFASTVNGTPPVLPQRALPTGVNPADVTVLPTMSGPGPSSIQFTFPSGTVLAVGQTYVITVPLFFRPGLVEGTNVVNSFEIRGDRLLNACTAPSGSTATTTSAGFGCTTSTVVRPALAPAVRALIAVKAEDTTGVDFPTNQFTGGTQGDCLAARDAAGFSRPPCAPTTIPGQEQTWRNTIQNTGTTSIKTLVIATRLPTVGDQTIVSDLVRSSRWFAEFTGQLSTNFGSASVTTYYTTAAEPCPGVLQSPTKDPLACGVDPATGWAVFPSIVPADASFFRTITGLQFLLEFPDGDLFDPAELGTIDIVTRTVALLDVFGGSAGPNPLAVNSLSVSGISSSGATLTPIAALDYSRAEVGLATGSVVIAKTITGPASGFVPDGQVFTGQLACTSLGETFQRPWSITVADVSSSDPSTTTIDDLPGGSECTVTETNASGQTTFTANTVIINPLADPAALPTINVVNDYQFARLLVEKRVTAGTGAVVPTQFEFTVSCTFLGVDVPLAPADAAFALDDGQSRIIGGIPANATCLVTETNDRGADITVVNASSDTNPNQGSSVVENNDLRTAEFIRLSPVESGDPAEPINQVEFNNRYSASALIILEKAFDGGDAAIDQFGRPRAFDINLVCTFEGTVQYNGLVTLSQGGNGFSQSIENVISGSQCEVSEPNLNGADAVVFRVDGGATPATTFTVPAPSTGSPSPIVTAEATNWFLTGSLQVTKEFDGDAGAISKFVTDVVPAVEFTVELVCRRDGQELVLPGGNERSLTASAPSATYTEIASGAACVLTETETGGAISWQILDAADNPVVGGAFDVVVDDSTLSSADQAQPPLTVLNTFRFATLSVAKVLSPDPLRSDWGPFEFTLACTLDGRPIDAREDAVQTIGAREAFTWTQLAEGADCVISETDTGGSVRVDHTQTMGDGAQSASVIGSSVTLASLRGLSDSPNEATFINWYALPNTGADAASAATLAAVGGVIVLIGAGLLGFATLRRSRRLDESAD